MWSAARYCARPSRCAGAGSWSSAARAARRRKSDCADPHYWETFAAVNLPGDAVSDEDLTTLIERADVGGICSAAAMAGRARDGVSTEGWRIEAWPIPADPYTVLVHCLAGSPEGETPGTVFRPA